MDKSLRGRSRRTLRTFTRWLAIVAAVFTLHRDRGLRAAREGNYGAPHVTVGLIASARAIRAGLDVLVSDCQSCKAKRTSDGLPPSQRVRLPQASTDKPHFKRPSLPTYVCAFCDGESLVSNSLKTFKERNA